LVTLLLLLLLLIVLLGFFQEGLFQDAPMEEAAGVFLLLLLLLLLPLLLPLVVLGMVYRPAWPSWSWGKPNILAALKPPVRLWRTESLTKETAAGAVKFKGECVLWGM
jgi:hypothetical protein